MLRTKQTYFDLCIPPPYFRHAALTSLQLFQIQEQSSSRLIETATIRCLLVATKTTPYAFFTVRHEPRMVSYAFYRPSVRVVEVHKGGRTSPFIYITPESLHFFRMMDDGT